MVDGCQFAKGLQAVDRDGFGFEMEPAFGFDLVMQAFFGDEEDWLGWTEWTAWTAGIIAEHVHFEDGEDVGGEAFAETGVVGDDGAIMTGSAGEAFALEGFEFHFFTAETRRRGAMASRALNHGLRSWMPSRSAKLRKLT